MISKERAEKLLPFALDATVRVSEIDWQALLGDVIKYECERLCKCPQEKMSATIEKIVRHGYRGWGDGETSCNQVARWIVYYFDDLLNTCVNEYPMLALVIVNIKKEFKKKYGQKSKP